MDVQNSYSLYCGTIRGVVVNTQCKKGKQPKYVIDKLGPASEITCMQWGRSQDEIVLGNTLGQVKLYSIPEDRYLSTIEDFEGKGPVVGLHCDDTRVFVAKKSGHISLRNGDDSDVLEVKLDDKGSLEKMIYNTSRENVIGTGGEFNNFRLWDVPTKKCIFQSKSLGHDELNLPIPTSIRDICFSPADEKLNNCATKEGMVLVYDERAQRRPVVKFSEPKASYTVISPAYREKQCLVGTTKGYMQLLDMKMPTKILKTFKSFTGSITGIQCDGNAPIVATASLDRFLRIHNLDTKELLHKEYMKQNLKCVLMKPTVKEEDEEAEVKDEEDNIDEEYEALFNQMETVTERVKPLNKELLKRSRNKCEQSDKKKSKKIKKI